MNVSSLLNNDNDDEKGPNRRASGQQPPRLPALRTNSSSLLSPAGILSPHSAVDSQHPSFAQSPELQRITRTDSHYNSPQQLPSPQAGNPYYSQPTVPQSPYGSSHYSPYGPPPSYAHAPQQITHASASSTPTTAHPYTPSANHGSPIARSAYPQQSYGHHQSPYPARQSPSAPPPGPMRVPSHSSRDSPLTASTMQSPSNVPYGSPRGILRPSPQPAIRNIVRASPGHEARPPATPSRTSSSISEKRSRKRSVSISPKTVVDELPIQRLQGPPMTPSDSGFLDSRSASRVNGSAMSTVMGSRGPESLSHHSISTANEENFLIDPLEAKSQSATAHRKANQQSLEPLSPKQDRESARMKETLDQHVPDRPMAISTEVNLPNANIREAPIQNSVQRLKLKIEDTPKNLAIQGQANKKRAYEADVTNGTISGEKVVKRRKFSSIPIWAQRCKATAPLPKYRGVAAAGGPTTAQPHVRAGAPIPLPATSTENALLGHWEPTFNDMIPHEEMTKAICDFLFQYVVMNKTLETRSAGGPTSNLGLLEIEAKLGTIIDRNTNDRLKLPVRTECILADNYDVAFESMMTIQQHATFNERLNDALRTSLEPSPKPRNPITYVHTRERDSFYELPQSEITNLPPGVRDFFTKPARKPRLRVTRDQKTGEVLAQIIKIRVADLHVYSPRTVFDWRISVSAEVAWHGDLARLMAASNGAAPATPGSASTHTSNAQDRNKDRVSYRHQASQIDLTQVKPTSATVVGAQGATHELEVELDASLVREHGVLAAEGREHAFVEVCRGFVDNVRTLARMGQ